MLVPMGAQHTCAWASPSLSGKSTQWGKQVLECAKDLDRYTTTTWEGPVAPETLGILAAVWDSGDGCLRAAQHLPGQPLPLASTVASALSAPLKT